MVFWRKKNNAALQDQERREEALIHRPSDPALELPTEYDSDMSPDLRHELLEETDNEVLEELDITPVPDHTPLTEAADSEAERQHDQEGDGGGWLSRLTTGLSKSSGKISTGLSGLLTKKKLDQDTLDALEDLLIEADLGPKTAARLVEKLAKDRFGKDIDEAEIREALAGGIAVVLEPVARPLDVKKPENGGPFTVLVCGVNGVGKTTTIGKMAWNLTKNEHKSVMIAAGDTFRAAAVEQLEIWAARTDCPLVKKDVGADPAAVAYESYAQAQEAGTDVLFIDTAGRLQNKKNLMEELGKIIRVLKKQDESLPHAVILVLDATTGQSAFSQVETFKELVDVTGLVVTKLDGAAKGGVLVGLADQFGVPVHAIGVGEGPEDMQPFSAEAYANSLMGLE